MRSSTIFTIAGITLVTSAVVYAVWFDSKRRNDAEFRRKLRASSPCTPQPLGKEKKKVEKSAAQQQTQSSVSASTSASAGPTTITQADLRTAIEKVKAEPVPASPDEKEAFFMQQVNMGEALCAQGGAFALPAAMCFFRALRVYPSPVELIMIYQQTVPEPIFKACVSLLGHAVFIDVLSAAYWNDFPPKSMGVTIEPVDVPDAGGTLMRKRVLVVNKDISAGDVIYKEHPIVTALDADLEGKGEYCSHCLRSMEPAAAIRPISDKFGSAYCSKECELKAMTQYQGLLFATESPVPHDIDPTNTPEQGEKRHLAQEKLVDLVKQSGKAGPLLVSRFVARQVSGELSKLFPGVVASAPTNEFGDSGFTFFDHMERLRYLELTVPENEAEAVRTVFKYTMEGLEQAINDERFAILKGKMAYNAYGVYHGEGRTDKPETNERPEDKEKTRTPVGTSKQIGSAFYFVSSYMQHNCDPSACVTFADGTAELVLTARRSLKAGDELTVAYVDVTRHEGETVIEARRRRRTELARGWRFPCTCQRCAAEAPPNTTDSVTLKDESKLEAPVERRFEKDAEEFIANID
ncbi:hypothetical protein K488DRAFT_46217 [Vararia minispora EC-137]|uniref:Uncharacterized protein n=1 Tax=Vararia minispora EC-137 TaxID=1314806 RepID=A0ACB8QRM3_9AGAM|nr:hypothetical protein K488DRAFT_46217 [Vararia minispora EC-137]